MADDPLAQAGLAPAPPDQNEPDNTDNGDSGGDPGTVVDPAILAQADNPGAVERAIQAERKAAREANARARELKAQLDARTAAESPLEDRVVKAEADDAASKHRLAQYEVAAQAGLPLDLAVRLQGNTAEELLADAESLKPRFVEQPPAPPATPAPTPAIPPEGGLRTPAPDTKKDPVKEHNATVLQAIFASRGQQVPGSDPLAGTGLQPAPDDMDEA